MTGSRSQVKRAHRRSLTENSKCSSTSLINIQHSRAKSKGKIKIFFRADNTNSTIQIKAADPGKEVVGSGDGLDGGSVWPGERRIFGSLVFLFKTFKTFKTFKVKVKVKDK
jgi:hypothetical protein